MAEDQEMAGSQEKHMTKKQDRLGTASCDRGPKSVTCLLDREVLELLCDVLPGILLFSLLPYFPSDINSICNT